MMKCSKCGIENYDATFCKNCGDSNFSGEAKELLHAIKEHNEKVGFGKNATHLYALVLKWIGNYRAAGWSANKFCEESRQAHAENNDFMDTIKPFLNYIGKADEAGKSIDDTIQNIQEIARLAFVEVIVNHGEERANISFINKDATINATEAVKWLSAAMQLEKNYKKNVEAFYYAGIGYLRTAGAIKDLFNIIMLSGLGLKSMSIKQSEDKYRKIEQPFFSMTETVIGEPQTIEEAEKRRDKGVSKILADRGEDVLSEVFKKDTKLLIKYFKGFCSCKSIYYSRQISLRPSELAKKSGIDISCIKNQLSLEDCAKELEGELKVIVIDAVSKGWSDESRQFFEPVVEELAVIIPEILEKSPFLKEFAGKVHSEKRNPASSNNSKCFVATAIYGSAEVSQVAFLRAWRNSVLLKTWYGRLAVDAYYKVGPFAAQVISDRPWLRKICIRISNLLLNRMGFRSSQLD